VRKETIRFKTNKEQTFIFYSTLHEHGENIFELFSEYSKQTNNLKSKEFILFCKLRCPKAYLHEHGAVTALEKKLRNALNTQR